MRSLCEQGNPHAPLPHRQRYQVIEMLTLRRTGSSTEYFRRRVAWRAVAIDKKKNWIPITVKKPWVVVAHRLREKPTLSYLQGGRFQSIKISDPYHSEENMYHGRTSMTLSPSPHDDTLRVDWRSCSCCSLEAFFKAAFVSANAWTSFSSDATAVLSSSAAFVWQKSHPKQVRIGGAGLSLRTSHAPCLSMVRVCTS